MNYFQRVQSEVGGSEPATSRLQNHNTALISKMKIFPLLLFNVFSPLLILTHYFPSYFLPFLPPPLYQYLPHSSFISSFSIFFFCNFYIPPSFFTFSSFSYWLSPSFPHSFSQCLPLSSFLLSLLPIFSHFLFPSCHPSFPPSFFTFSCFSSLSPRLSLSFFFSPFFLLTLPLISITFCASFYFFKEKPA